MTDYERTKMLEMAQQALLALQSVSMSLSHIVRSLAGVDETLTWVTGEDLSGKKFIRTGDFVADLLRRHDDGATPQG